MSDAPSRTAGTASTARRPRMADPQALGDLLLYRLSRLAGARQLHGQLFPGIAALNRELLSVLSPEAIGALESSLERLQTQADQLAATCALPEAGRLRGRARP